MMSEKEMVFGIQSVTEALKSGQNIEKIFLQKEIASGQQFQEIITLAHKSHVLFQRVPVQKINYYTKKNHQGVLALLSSVTYLETSNVIQGLFEDGKTPLVLVLDRITDVRNFGAIARTAECAGVDAIILPLRGGSQVTSDAMKTSSGALHYMQICREFNLPATVEYLKNCGLQIVACTEKTQNNIFNVDFTVPTALVLGSEEDGISQEILNLADVKGAIPVLGNIESLNVSVSAGVALYEAVRQRGEL